jgi:hypothetical protein
MRDIRKERKQAFILSYGLLGLFTAISIIGPILIGRKGWSEKTK